MTTASALKTAALKAVDARLAARGYWLPAESRSIIAEAIAVVFDAEVDEAQRLACRFQTRLDAARVLARSLNPEQQHQLLAILAGREDRP
ncbi:hypothetical protein ACIPW5_11275 [Streptomyces sp. NPDC090077]|uniref:hypothetical protein n=1 Tax=Streptomyces sp. NPDC090077 TaxID=3365938 RepID=UPI003805352E